MDFSKKIGKSLCDIDSTCANVASGLSSYYKRLTFGSNILDSLPDQIDDFDTETIWQILNMQNNHNKLSQDVSGLIQKSTCQSAFKFASKDKDPSTTSDVEPSDVDDEETEELNDVKTECIPAQKCIKKQKWKASEVDDEFFKLSEMEVTNLY